MSILGMTYLAVGADMGSIDAGRRARRRHAAAVLLSGLVGSLALAGTSAAIVPLTVHATASPVCGGLTADASFASESGLLGRSHACEHLREREAPSSALGIVADAVHSRLAAAAEMARLPTTNPAVIGRWSRARNPGTQTVGVAAVLLHTGKVLLFGQLPTDTATTGFVFDPASGTGHAVPVPAPIFCGSVTPLSDGQILSVGGADPTPRGIPDVWLFKPHAETWVRQPDTPLGRYYPTSTRLPDGRIVIAAGKELDGSTRNPAVEVYRQPAPGAGVGTLSVVGTDHPTSYYPHQVVMPDGQMLQVESSLSYTLNPATWTWSQLPSLPMSLGAGSAHLVLPGPASGATRVMVIGGLHAAGARATTQVLDYAKPAAGWARGPSMPTARAHMNVVQVPDGSAYGIGGNAADLNDSPRPRTLHYDPSTQRWTSMAVQSSRRAYHSTALLLPDGRIMSAGDNYAGGGLQRIDFYSPPYLFRGKRPRISSAPRQVASGRRFTIKTSGPPVTRAVLMAPGSTTHANEMNARHVRLAVTRTRTGFVATAPTKNAAPPGYYMLFVLRHNGVPSVARWVHVGHM